MREPATDPHVEMMGVLRAEQQALREEQMRAREDQRQSREEIACVLDTMREVAVAKVRLEKRPVEAETLAETSDP